MNPYQQWLGLYNISGMTKPNYYELLGLPFGESNPYVIEQAANEMATRLNSVNPGPDVALWQSLMADIQNAQRCLCNPASRMEYDNSLRNGGGYGGGFNGGYSAGSAFGAPGNMGYQQAPMAQPPIPPSSGGFGSSYSAGAAFGGAPQMATPPIPSAPPVPSSPTVAPVSSVPPVPTAPAAPTAQPVATPVATAATVAAAATVATAATAATAKAATPPAAPPSPTGGANLNIDSKKKKVHKRAGAGSGALYGIYTALGLGGLILTLWLFSLAQKAKEDENANNQSQRVVVIDDSTLQGTKNLPRRLEKEKYTGEKIEPVAAPKKKTVIRKSKDGIPVRTAVDDLDDGSDAVTVGDKDVVVEKTPDIRELGVSDDSPDVVVERPNDFAIGTAVRDNVDSVEEAIEHSTGIDIAPNPDGETAPNFSARRTDDGDGAVVVVDDPLLATGSEGAIQVTRRSRGGVRIGDTAPAPVVKNDAPVIENNAPPVSQPAPVAEAAPDVANYDNIADELVISTDKSGAKDDAPSDPAPAKDPVEPEPAVEEPQPQNPAPEPKVSEPQPEPAVEQPAPAAPQEEPKADPAPKSEPADAPAEPAPENPKSEPEPKAAENAKPAPPAKVDIPKESEIMTAEAKIETDNADAFKSGDSGAKSSLAQKLIDQAGDSSSPAEKMAALNIARNLATDAQNVDLALKAIELKSKAFNDVDSYNEGLDVLLSCKANAWPENQKKAVAAAAEKWLKVAKKKNESRNAKKLQEIIDANK